MTPFRIALLAGLLALTGCGPHRAAPSQLILWAWERPEDLRFAGPEVEVAVQTGFVALTGDSLWTRGRRFPLKVNRAPDTALVHVEINRSRPLNWTPTLRARTAAAVLHYALSLPVKRVQVDFEVRASERQVLLDLLGDVRKGLPKGVALSMTALASWCQTETWLDAAPVDEITPMLFRMEDGGDAIRKRLAAGEDFHNPRCRSSLAVSTDAAIVRAPAGRRVYLFNPGSWTAADFQAARREIAVWR